MMDLLLATSGGEAQAASGGYVDDVFSAYTYTGNGSTQTINNGIDLAGKGGMAWVKSRSAATDHQVFDTERTATYELITNSTAAQVADADTLTAFSSNGFSLGADATTNANTATYASWTFRKAPKFFDVVTFTTDVSGNGSFSHSLGVTPGMIITKATTAAGGWVTWHKDLTTGYFVQLQLTGAQVNAGATWCSATSSTVTFSQNVLNQSATVVAYLFAHDPSAEGIIQCGSYVGNGSAVGPEVNLGWEPQYVMIKAATVHSAGWYIFDSMRGITTGGLDPALTANASNAESSFGPADFIDVTSTGFKLKTSDAGVNGGGSPAYTYLAIRRSNKPPTSGAQVYNAIARTGTGAAATVTGVGFAPDLVIPTVLISSGGNGSTFHDRLRGKQNILFPTGVNGELARTDANMYFRFGSDGIEVGVDSTSYINYIGYPYINHFFRRAKGVFDVVCDTGTGVAHSVNHGLSAAPEFIIRKSRSGETQWECWHSALAATEKLVLNSTAAKATDATAWNSTLPTSTQFTVGTGANVNTNAATYVTYLFATLAGISKVGSYTGNGTSQTINCGFSTGSRFILVKRTDATGDWYVWDSVRGIIAANDPHLSINTTAAEVTTDDSVDPEASGFIVNQNTATNINVTGGQYIFLAIA